MCGEEKTEYTLTFCLHSDFLKYNANILDVSFHLVDFEWNGQALLFVNFWNVFRFVYTGKWEEAFHCTVTFVPFVLNTKICFLYSLCVCVCTKGTTTTTVYKSDSMLKMRR